MRPASILLCLIAAAFALAACAVPGVPLPPSLGLPKPVGDLKAERKRSAVTLTWVAAFPTSPLSDNRQTSVT